MTLLLENPAFVGAGTKWTAAVGPTRLLTSLCSRFEPRVATFQGAPKRRRRTIRRSNTLIKISGGADPKGAIGLMHCAAPRLTGT